VPAPAPVSYALKKGDKETVFGCKVEKAPARRIGRIEDLG
jgi:hypothetical protein